MEAFLLLTKVMDNQELTKEEKLAIEEQAIQALLQWGVKFQVPLKIEPGKMPKRILWWNRHFPRWAKTWKDARINKSWDIEETEIRDIETNETRLVYMRNFRIKPLYLGTIDAIRRLYLEIEYNEDALENDPLEESEKFFKYTSLMAEVAAIAVINSGCIVDPLDTAVQELKHFFISHLDVNRLQRLSMVINQMRNSAGFTASIRFIREVGTTKPRADRVE